MITNTVTQRQKVVLALKAQPWRLAIIAASLVMTIVNLYRGEFVFSLLWLSIILQALTLGVLGDRQYEYEAVADVLAQLKIEHGMLHVKHRQLHVQNVKKIALDALDDDYAYIDLPFNIYRSVAMRFPIAQMPLVKDWISTHLPHAEIIC
ncbi:hypothetical protein [Alishewanella tabrizica]|uniref:Uncharacterized protein n=1 Tax=Alishewanella tabrizica TaxID=671278 RepID=A0ABQ2WS96_9ALTE|nr:hypothetical protein [Alishewanella tabrizica]GGW66143.1 hypothetical protein GCM10008111_22610 [Alishewanella tabrizica]